MSITMCDYTRNESHKNLTHFFTASVFPRNSKWLFPNLMIMLLFYIDIYFFWYCFDYHTESWKGPKTDGKTFENSKEETTLSVVMNNKLTCFNHIKELWKETSGKIIALWRILPYFMKSEFDFQVLIKSFLFLFCSRAYNNIIEKIEKRSVRVTLVHLHTCLTNIESCKLSTECSKLHEGTFQNSE